MFLVTYFSNQSQETTSDFTIMETVKDFTKRVKTLESKLHNFNKLKDFEDKNT